MVHIQWKDRYNISYKDIDEQHKGLLGILNDLIDLVESQSSPDQVTHIFHRLFEYTQIHFATEEKYLRKARWVGLLPHLAEHATFSRKLLDLNQRYDPSNPKLIEETLAFLRSWYLNHIMDMDMQYVPHLHGLRGKLAIRAVLLPFEGVLGTFDRARFAARLGELTGREPAALAADLRGDASPVRDYECGRIDAGEFRARIAATAETEIAAEDLAGAYVDGWTPNPEVFDLLQALKANYKLGLICESGPWRVERVLQPLPVFPLFDAVALSQEIKAMGSFLITDLLEKLNLIAEECVQIDAREARVEEAGGNRFHAVKFTTAEALAKHLKGLNLEF